MSPLVKQRVHGDVLRSGSAPAPWGCGARPRQLCSLSALAAGNGVSWQGFIGCSVKSLAAEVIHAQKTWELWV